MITLVVMLILAATYRVVMQPAAVLRVCSKQICFITMKNHDQIESLKVQPHWSGCCTIIFMSAIVQYVLLYLYEVLNAILSQFPQSNSFKGHWLLVFNPYSTVDRPTGDNPVIPPMMCAFLLGCVRAPKAFEVGQCACCKPTSRHSCFNALLRDYARMHECYRNPWWSLLMSNSAAIPGQGQCIVFYFACLTSINAC